MEIQGTAIPLILLLLPVLSKLIGSNAPQLEKESHKSHHCKEQMIHDRRTLNCIHQNLTYIPKTNEYIQGLVFSFNDLTNITMETFGNISNPGNIIDLELDHNHIRNISVDGFDAFPKLKYLNLSYNSIYYDNLKNVLGALSNFKFLFHLEISGIITIKIQKNLFSLMKKNYIGTLVVQYYTMKQLTMDTFRTFNSLQSLYLRDNHIEELTFFKHKHLYSLYIDHNNLRSFPDFSVSGNESYCYFKNLEIIDIQNNYVDELSPDNFRCLKNLKSLKAGGNPIKVLPNNLLSKVPKIQSLNLNYLNGGSLKVQPFAFNSSSLTKIHLEFGGTATAVFQSFNDTFSYSPKLRILILGRISMLKIPNQLISDLFSPLVHLTLFQCFGCQISGDPKFILKSMPYVVSISLQSNLITSLSGETFKKNKRLRHLSLRYNELGHIPESVLPISLLNRLHLLDLSENPFVCDCDLEWFINWMNSKQNKKIISRYPKEYTCSFPVEKSKMQLSEISFTYKECHPWSPWIWVAIIASPCVIVIGITALILYRNRWKIKHYIYLLRKRRNYQVINGNNFVYDAFVGYEAEDSAWVQRRLLAVLEDEVGLKLCIHERDFQPGVFINDNIVTSMDKSAKVILVLTNAFARSGWCMFELKVAHSKLIEEEAELVVILLEKIDGRNMNHSLKVLFDTTTYIEWTEDVVGQELFWTKLKTVLRR